MSKPIDYSKWDKLHYGSSSDEEENQPRVTKLNSPGKVTRTPDGTITFEKNATPVEKNATETPSKDKLTHNGGSYIDPKRNNQILWSQDRYEVQISIPYCASSIHTKSITVECHGILPYENRYCATTNLLSNTVKDNETHGSLTIKGKNTNNDKITIFQGMLPHFIHSPEEEEDIEWCIETTNSIKNYTNLIRITLLKAVPMEGVFIWWDQLVRDGPKINLDLIEGRSGKEKEGSFKDVWNEAHDLFRKKMEK